MKERRRFTRDFKLAALARFQEAGDVRALALELGIRRELLYKWRGKFEAGGAEALSTSGRPRPAPGLAAEPMIAGLPESQRVAELEGKIGRQALELDFFRAALQQLRDRRRRNGGPIDPTSMR